MPPTPRWVCIALLLCLALPGAAATLDRTPEPEKDLDGVLQECEALQEQLRLVLTEAGRMERLLAWRGKALAPIRRIHQQAWNHHIRAALAIREAREQIRQRGTRLQRLRGRLRAALEQPVLVADFSYQLRAEIDLRTRTLMARAEFPAGLTYSTDRLRALLQGKPSLPEVDPLRLASLALGLRTRVQTDYDAVRLAVARDAGPRTVIYFSNPGFVEAFAPETLVDHAIKGALTSGATLDATQAELRQVLHRELHSVQAFLTDYLGSADGVEYLVHVVESLLKLRSFRLPQVEFRILRVRAVYEGTPAGFTALAQHLTERPVVAPVVRTVVPRLAFALLITLPEGRPLPLYREFRAVLDRPATPLPVGVLGKLPPLPALTVESFLVPEVVRRLREVDVAELKPVWEERPVLDLRGTALAQFLGDRIQFLGWGNQGLVLMERFSLDLHTGQMEFVMTIHVRHSTSLVEVARLLDRTMDELGDDLMGAVRVLRREIAELQEQLAPILEQVATARSSLGEALDCMHQCAEFWPQLGQSSRVLSGLVRLGRALERQTLELLERTRHRLRGMRGASLQRTTG